MTNNHPSVESIAESVQGAMAEIYKKGFNEGRLVGYAEGVEAARKCLLGMQTTPLASNVEAQEARSGVPLTTPIEDLGLSSMRTYNFLKREGLHTIGDLLRFNEQSSLFSIRNFGPKSGSEVQAALEELGYVIDLRQY